jgi:hypothetical protein
MIKGPEAFFGYGGIACALILSSYFDIYERYWGSLWNCQIWSWNCFNGCLKT